MYGSAQTGDRCQKLRQLFSYVLLLFRLPEESAFQSQARADGWKNVVCVCRAYFLKPLNPKPLKPLNPKPLKPLNPKPLKPLNPKP